jgi:hypothetical protein
MEGSSCEAILPASASENFLPLWSGSQSETDLSAILTLGLVSHGPAVAILSLLRFHELAPHSISMR